MTNAKKGRPAERQRLRISSIDAQDAWERRAHDAEERRRRVVKALIALRDVKSLGMDPEPLIRKMRVQVEQLPKLADELEYEDAATIAQLLQIEAWRILEEVEETLMSLYDQPRSPALARYLDADRNLKQFDLKDE